MKSKKRVLALLLIGLMLVGNMNTVMAAEQSKLYNVSTVRPVVNWGISTYDLGKPSTSAYVDLSEEALYFAGEAERSTLYTNSHFKGKESVKYSITNDSTYSLTVKVYKANTLFDTKVATIKVAANSTAAGTISDLDKSGLYYLSFSAPSDFEGKVY